MFSGNLEIKTIYVPATCAGSTGLVMSGGVAGVDVTKFDGPCVFVLSVSTSSTAGATDKIDVTVQTSTSSIHSDAYTDVVSFTRNVTGSTQFKVVNANELSKYARIKAVATGTFVVGLTMIGSTNS